jgi:hypothetical protein
MTPSRACVFATIALLAGALAPTVRADDDRDEPGRRKPRPPRHEALERFLRDSRTRSDDWAPILERLHEHLRRLHEQLERWKQEWGNGGRDLRGLHGDSGFRGRLQRKAPALHGKARPGRANHGVPRQPWGIDGLRHHAPHRHTDRSVHGHAWGMRGDRDAMHDRLRAALRRALLHTKGVRPGHDLDRSLDGALKEILRELRRHGFPSDGPGAHRGPGRGPRMEGGGDERGPRPDVVRRRVRIPRAHGRRLAALRDTRVEVETIADADVVLVDTALPHVDVVRRRILVR